MAQLVITKLCGGRLFRCQVILFKSLNTHLALTLLAIFIESQSEWALDSSGEHIHHLTSPGPNRLVRSMLVLGLS